jgi:hypothetical protein
MAALRSLHTTQKADAEVPTTSSSSSSRPMTEIAKAGSNQLSLETPNNKAGVLICYGFLYILLNTLQSMFCRRWTRLPTGHDRVLCGL